MLSEIGNRPQMATGLFVAFKDSILHFPGSWRYVTVILDCLGERLIYKRRRMSVPRVSLSGSSG